MGKEINKRCNQEENTDLGVRWRIGNRIKDSLSKLTETGLFAFMEQKGLNVSGLHLKQLQ